MNRVCHVIMHTHWDREWYYSFEQYRARLLDLADKIVIGLSKQTFDCFVLDGQVAVIDDLFEVCEPDIEVEIRKFIKLGKLILGPWYVLADEFLVNQESLIRNLEIGIKKSLEFGSCQKVGYLPDTFGHVGQMPQILKYFDIHFGVLWRGLTPDTSELNWVSPDGSSVKTVWLFDGYYTPHLEDKKYHDLLSKHVEKGFNFTDTNHIILTNGGDHIIPYRNDYKDRMKELSSDVEFRFSDFESYFKVMPDEVFKENIYGELRGNKTSYVLPNVLSTRYYLKKSNTLVEDKMLGHIEPLEALLFSNTLNPIDKFMNKIWDNILLNQPHDSICGCSVDSVHKTMEDRYERLSMDLRMADEMLLLKAGLKTNSVDHENHLLRKPFDDDSQFMLFNSACNESTRELSTELIFAKKSLTDLGYQLDNLKFLSVRVNDQNYLADVFGTEEVKSFDSPHDGFPDFKDRVKLKIFIKDIKIPPMSIQPCQVLKFADIGSKNPNENLENEFLKVTLNIDGTLNVFDKLEGKLHECVNAIFRELDQGDTYNFSRPDEADFIRAELIPDSMYYKAHNHFAELFYRLSITGSKSLKEDRQGPCEVITASYIDVNVKLMNHAKKLVFALSVDNNHLDQRLSVSFPVNKVNKSYYTDTSFELVKRQGFRQELDRWTEEYQEVPVVVDPSHSMVFIDDFSFYHRALHEVQLEQNMLRVTLLRSVGYLSRSDLNSRKIGAGPNYFETPDAQCIGSYDYDYVLDFEKHSPVESKRQASLFKNPLIKLDAYGQSIDNESLINIVSKNIMVSSLRKVIYENVPSIEIRCYNITDKIIESNLFAKGLIHGYIKSSESNIESLLVQDKTIKLELKPHEIKTYIIQLENLEAE